jgi:hypothetical protein
MANEPKLVRVIDTFFDGERLHHPGEVFLYSGPMPPKGDPQILVLEGEESPAPEKPARKGRRGGAPAPSWSTEGRAAADAESPVQ